MNIVIDSSFLNAVKDFINDNDRALHSYLKNPDNALRKTLRALKEEITQPEFDADAARRELEAKIAEQQKTVNLLQGHLLTEQKKLKALKAELAEL